MAFTKIRSLLKNLLLSAVVFVVSVEFLSFAAIKTKMIPADAPSYEWPTFVPFWDQLDKKFSNAASAFFPSPHDQAIVLTMDGVGE